MLRISKFAMTKADFVTFLLKVESAFWPILAHQAGAYSGFCTMKRLGFFYSPLDGMLVHRRVTSALNLKVSIYTPGYVKRGTMRAKCLAQDHNTMSPARARTRTAHSGVERTNHEVTAPPTTFL